MACPWHGDASDEDSVASKRDVSVADLVGSNSDAESVLRDFIMPSDEEDDEEDDPQLAATDSELSLDWNAGTEVARLDFERHWLSLIDPPFYKKQMARLARHIQKHGRVIRLDSKWGELVATIRKYNSKNPFDPIRVRWLQRLGFPFDAAAARRYEGELLPNEAAYWEKGIALLRQYFNEHGHSNVPSGSKDTETEKLYRFTNRVRDKAIAGDLLDWQEDELTSLCFCYDKRQPGGVPSDAQNEAWNDNFNTFLAFKARNDSEIVGGVNNGFVPESHPDLSSGFCGWAAKQRDYYRENRQTPSWQARQELLDDAGFQWKKMRLPSQSQAEINKVMPGKNKSVADLLLSIYDKGFACGTKNNVYSLHNSDWTYIQEQRVVMQLVDEVMTDAEWGIFSSPDQPRPIVEAAAMHVQEQAMQQMAVWEKKTTDRLPSDNFTAVARRVEHLKGKKGEQSLGAAVHAQVIAVFSKRLNDNEKMQRMNAKVLSNKLTSL